MNNVDDAEAPPPPRDPYRTQRWIDTVTANVVSGIVLYVLGVISGVFPRSAEVWAVIAGAAGYGGLFVIMWWTFRKLARGQQFSPRHRRIGNWALNAAVAAILVFEIYHRVL